MKNLVASVIFVVLLFNGISIFASDDIKAEEVVVYGICEEDFQEFLNNPNKEILTKSPLSISKYYLSDTEENTIECDIWYEDGEKRSMTAKSGYFRIGSLPIYSKFVTFFSDYSEVQKFMQAQDIDCIVSDVTILTCAIKHEFYVAEVAFVETDRGNYFITLDEDAKEHVEIISEKSAQEDYMMVLRTQQNYVDKYNLYAAMVYIGDEKILCNPVTMIRNKGAYMPLRSIFEGLGCEVKWDCDTNIARICTSEKTLRLRIKDGNLTMIDYPEPYNVIGYYTVDERTVITSSGLYQLAKSLFNEIELKVDSESRLVQIRTF